MVNCQKQKLKWILITGFIILFVFIANLLLDSGILRSVSNYGLDGCQKITNIPGPEDFVYSHKYQVAFLSSDPRPNGVELGNKNGNIWLIRPSDLDKRNLTSQLNFEFHPHGIGLFENNEETFLYVVNHKKEVSTVEVFSWANDQLLHLRTIEDELLINPNDIVPISKDAFYLSHDHGNKNIWLKKLEIYSRFGRGYISFYDGRNFKVVAKGISYANGLAVDMKNNKLYHASMLGNKVMVFQILSSFDLSIEKEIKIEGAPDNLYLDDNGNLWTGIHMNAFALKSHMQDHQKLSPFEILMIKDPSGKAKIEKVMGSDGQLMSGASGGYPIQDKLFVGSIFQNHFLVCPLKTSF